MLTLKNTKRKSVPSTIPSKKFCKTTARTQKVLNFLTHLENYSSGETVPLTRREQCQPTGRGGCLTRPERRRRWCSSWPASHPGTWPSSSFPPSSRPRTPGAHARLNRLRNFFSAEVDGNFKENTLCIVQCWGPGPQDPYVLGLPDAHPEPLVTHKYGSGSETGSGSFLHQAKIVGN
jgi:hypothetical protein